MLDEHRFARAVARIHAADLRDRGVRLVDDEEEVLRQKVHQRVRPRAGRASAQVAGVVLDAVAEAHLLHHLEVELGAHLDALGLDELAGTLELHHTLVEFLADGAHGRVQLVVGRDELLRGIEREVREAGGDVAGEGIELADAVDLIAEELDADGAVVHLRGMDLDGVAAHAELAALEGDVVAFVEHVHELREECLAGHLLALADRDEHLEEVLGRGEAVDAETLATTSVSRRESSELTAERRRRSISSLMEESFSM